jgi:hypothetical protein
MALEALSYITMHQAHADGKFTFLQVQADVIAQIFYAAGTKRSLTLRKTLALEFL